MEQTVLMWFFFGFFFYIKGLLIFCWCFHRNLSSVLFISPLFSLSVAGCLQMVTEVFNVYFFCLLSSVSWWLQV